MSDAVRRALRGLAQFIAGGGLTLLIDEVVVSLTSTQRYAVMAVMTALVTFCQNALEDRGTIPAVLKSPASSGVDPASGI